MLKLIKDISRALWVKITSSGTMAIVIGVDDKKGGIDVDIHSNKAPHRFVLAMLEGAAEAVKEDAIR